MPYAPLTTLEDAKLYLEIGQSVTSGDVQLQALIEELSELIGQYCGRPNLGSVESYVERRTMPGPATIPTGKPMLFQLRQYPVVALQSVQFGFSTAPVTSIPIVTDPLATCGALLLEDQRTVEFIGRTWVDGGPVVISYTAGYVGFDVPNTPCTIPKGLQRVIKQWLDEIRKAAKHTGYKSQSLAGQNITWELGAVKGMSPRTEAMLQPYINRVPSYG